MMCSCPDGPHQFVVSPRLWKAANGKIPLDQGMSGEPPSPPPPPPPPPPQEQQQSHCSTPKRQYPAVDFSRYPSLLRLGLVTHSYSGYSPDFRASGVFGLKRLRSDGGPSWSGAAATAQTSTITSTRELLASLAGCRSPSSSSSSLSSFLSISGVPVGHDGIRRPAGVYEVGERQAGAGAMVDPVEVLFGEVSEHIFQFLDSRSLGACLAVSWGWNKCATADVLWNPICKQMWEGKMHVISSILDPAIPRLQAFQTSLAEAQRVRIEPEDLCSCVWEFHCKEEAGEYWRQLDPYYHGLPLMRRIFHEDGHVTAEPMDRIWGGHECSWTLKKPKSRGGAPLVQINHWPPMLVTRTPDWGWNMENAYVVYTSTTYSR